MWQVGKGRARGQKAAFHPAFALWALALGFLLSSPFRFRRFSCNDHTTLATACGRLRRRRGSWTREPGSTRLRPNLRRLLKSAEGRDRGGGGGRHQHGAAIGDRFQGADSACLSSWFRPVPSYSMAERGAGEMLPICASTPLAPRASLEGPSQGQGPSPPSKPLPRLPSPLGSV